MNKVVRSAAKGGVPVADKQEPGGGRARSHVSVIEA
jgi:hypothetical protein